MEVSLEVLIVFILVVPFGIIAIGGYIYFTILQCICKLKAATNRMEIKKYEN